MEKTIIETEAHLKEEFGFTEEEIEKATLRIIDSVDELNEEYGLDLSAISEYEYSPEHFNEGTWYITKDGKYFVRIY